MVHDKGLENFILMLHKGSLLYCRFYTIFFWRDDADLEQFVVIQLGQHFLMRSYELSAA